MVWLDLWYLHWKLHFKIASTSQVYSVGYIKAGYLLINIRFMKIAFEVPEKVENIKKLDIYTFIN